MDLFFEILRAVVLTSILLFMLRFSGGILFPRLPGFRLLLTGGVLLLFGTIMDVASAYFSYDGWFFVSDKQTQMVLNRLFGYLGGFVFIGAGIWRLLPGLIEHEAIISEELGRAKAGMVLLGRFVPICTCCKKVRDENGEWVEIESFIRSRANTEFSHTYCPKCEQEELKAIEDFSI